jgi:hypothetical protein
MASMRILFLSIMLLAYSGGLNADDSDLPDWTVERIRPVHDGVSRWVDAQSRNLDGFFGNDETRLSVNNKSYLRLGSDVEWVESEGFNIDPSIRFKLDLPTTKERLRLIIESEPEESRGTLSEQGTGRLRDAATNSDSTVIGLSRLSEKDKTRHWDTRVGAGVKFRLPLDPYMRLSSERLWSLGDGPWQLESYNRLSWFNSDGYSARSRWDIGRPLDDTRHMRFLTNIQWQEDVDTLELSQSAEINQILSRRSAMRYAAVVVGNSASRPRINDYYLLTQYRRNLHKDILFADVIPELHFPRETRFEPRWALSLRLEMYFSGNVIDRQQEKRINEDLQTRDMPPDSRH